VSGAPGNAADVLVRARRFLEATGGPLDRLREAALVSTGDAAWREAWWRAQSGSGAFALPGFSSSFASTLCAVATLDDLGELRGGRVARSITWLGQQQDGDGGWTAPGGDALARTVVSGLVAGYLAKTPYARPSVLRRAGAFLGAAWSPDQVRSGAFGPIAAFAHFFANAPHELGDAALQWCGREMERGYRSGRLSVEQVARLFTLCDAGALPGTRIHFEEILETLRSRQVQDGGWLPGAAPAARCAATWDAAIALRRGGEARFAGTPVAGQASLSSAIRPKLVGSEETSMFNLATIHEAIAAVAPDRDCLIFRDRRYTWAQTTDRTRRLAAVLRGHGLGCHTERDQLENWDSGQDHVALYLYNGNEYLEGMLGSYKARCAPFNVNYRYVEEELLYLFDNADARAVIYHAQFAPVLAKIRDRLTDVGLWIQVEDESGEALLPGALEYEAALADAAPEEPTGLSPDDLYILYTGGTTGMPKGVLWRQEDIYLSALGGPRPPRDLEELVEKARERDLRTMAAPPFMHGAAHWVAFNVWGVGGTVVVQSNPYKLDPHDIWSMVEKERVNTLTIVGDAFGRPLLDQLDKETYDLSSLKMMTSGGAILTATLKDEFLRKVPNMRILDALGSSESGAQAAQFSQKGQKATTGDFAVIPGNVVLKEDLSGVIEPGSGEVGWLAKAGRIPLGYYKDPEKSRATFPTVAGQRYSVPGDRATIEADGSVRLLGRDSVTINSGGEKIFAEEVEHAIKHHPDVYDAVVVGTPHERWGNQVTALVRLRDGAQPDEAALLEVARQHIANYKTPKAFVWVDELVRAPSGKPDYRWAKERALKSLGGSG